jgi:DNA repair protein RadD
MGRLEATLARIGERRQSAFLDPSLVHLIDALEEGGMSIDVMVDLMIQIHTKVGILRNKQLRTILVRALPVEQAEELCDLLSLNNGETYDLLTKMRIIKKSHKEESLFSWFGIMEGDMPIEEEIIESPTTVVSKGNHGLFKHQSVALDKVEKFFSTNANRAFLHMPTGSGKTRTAINHICKTLNDGQPRLILWLAYSGELCEQAAQEFEKAWFHHGNRDVEMVRMWGDHDVDTFPRDGIVFAGLDKLRTKNDSNETFLANLAHRIDLIVFDEAHQSTAGTYQLMVDILLDLNSECDLLGLSATPGRTWNDPEKDKELSDMYYSQKVALEVEGYENPIDFLVSEGYLSNPIMNQLPSDSGPLNAEEVAAISEMMDYNPTILNKLATDQARNLLIIRKIEQLIREGHKRILVFAISMKHSDILSMVFARRGYRCASITSKSNPDQRKIWLKRFVELDDEPCVLFNYGVLTTGFDAPKTSAAVIARPTKSLVLYSQMIGRVIRGPKVKGTKTAEIWTVVDQQLPGFGTLAGAFWNWEDVW